MSRQREHIRFSLEGFKWAELDPDEFIALPISLGASKLYVYIFRKAVENVSKNLKEIQKDLSCARYTLHRSKKELIDSGLLKIDRIDSIKIWTLYKIPQDDLKRNKVTYMLQKEIKCQNNVIKRNKVTTQCYKKTSLDTIEPIDPRIKPIKPIEPIDRHLLLRKNRFNTRVDLCNIGVKGSTVGSTIDSIDSINNSCNILHDEILEQPKTAVKHQRNDMKSKDNLSLFEDEPEGSWFTIPKAGQCIISELKVSSKDLPLLNKGLHISAVWYWALKRYEFYRIDHIFTAASFRKDCLKYARSILKAVGNEDWQVHQKYIDWYIFNADPFIKTECKYNFEYLCSIHCYNKSISTPRPNIIFTEEQRKAADPGIWVKEDGSIERFEKP